MRRLITVGFVIAGLMLAQVHAATWYVDSSKSDSNTGLSWVNAFATITNAAAALAATNAFLGYTGDHLVLVTNGTYAERVYLNQTHRGAPGAPNTFRGVDDPLIDAWVGSPYYIGCFHIYGSGTGDGSRADYITIEGFLLESSTLLRGVMVRNAEHVTVRNCTHRGNGSHAGFRFENVAAYGTVENCTTYCAEYTGIYMGNCGGNMTIKNCIVVGSGQWGIYLAAPGTPMIVSNNLIFANSRGNVHWTDGSDVNFAADINALSSDVGENRVSNPGLAAMWDNYKADSFFANSPCLGAADDGGNLGAYQSATIVPVSSENWYVKTDGDNAAAGDSWATAWQTISTATSTAGPGDTVTIDAGTYMGQVAITQGGSSNLWVTYQANGDVHLETGATVLFFDGVSGVAVDGFSMKATAGSATVYPFHSPSNVVRNCDIDGYTYGVSMYASAHCVFQNCDIHDASSHGVYVQGSYAYDHGDTYVIGGSIHDNGGDGFWTRSSHNVVKDCNIYNNVNGVYASSGSHDYKHTEIINCNIYSNTYGVFGGQHGGLAAFHCTIYGNTEGIRTDAVNGGQVWAWNCIVAGNSNYGVHELVEARGAHVNTCLFWDNGAGGSDHFLDGDANLWDTASEIDAESDCAGNLIGDPSFINAAQNNYRLKPGSAAIDTADDSYTPKYSTGATYTSRYGFPNLADDLYANSRPKGAGLDIGAHEWQPWAGTVILVR